MDTLRLSSGALTYCYLWGLDGRGADDFATAIAYEHAVARAFLDGGAGDGHIPPWAVALQNSLGALRGEVAAVRGEVGHIRVSLQRTELYAAQVRLNMVFLF